MNQMPEIQKDYADKIVQEARDFYHKIKSIYDSTGYSRSYQLGHTWEAGSVNVRDMISIINSDVGAVESIRLIDNTVMFSVNSPTPIKEKMTDWYIAYLRRCGCDIFNLDISMQEPPVTNPAVCVSRGDRLLTPDFLYRVILCLEIQKYCSISGPRFHIVELGGGCGRLARTLKLFTPNSLYVDIDIPETLYFAYIFLKLNFPNARTCYVTDPSQLKDGIRQFDFVFIPTIFADCIREHEFDLFCNTASLGEMTNPTIRYWMHFVQNRLKVRYFFGFNRFLNIINLRSQFGRRRLDENECSVLFDANWKILHWELEPPFIRCPYEEPLFVSRQLEIIAERLPDSSVNESDNQLVSQQIVKELTDEYWVRVPDVYIHLSMGGHRLTHDLDMSGTLFKLWESIRLYPHKTNVAMMLEYLHTLAKRDSPFEEWFYYRNLLNVLTNNTSESAVSCWVKMLLQENYRRLWKDALTLSIAYNISYNPFSTAALLYFINGFLPPFIRPALIKLYRALYYSLSSVPPHLRKMKQSLAKSFPRVGID